MSAWSSTRDVAQPAIACCPQVHLCSSSRHASAWSHCKPRMLQPHATRYPGMMAIPWRMHSVTCMQCGARACKRGRAVLKSQQARSRYCATP